MYSLSCAVCLYDAVQVDGSAFRYAELLERRVQIRRREDGAVEVDHCAGYTRICLFKYLSGGLRYFCDNFLARRVGFYSTPKITASNSLF